MYRFDTPALKTLLGFFLYFINRHRLKFSGLLFTMTLWPITEASTHYFVKLIIDGVVEYKGDRALIFQIILWPIAGYMAATLGLELALRVEDWFKIITLPQVRAEIRGFLFAHAQKHSHRYFQEQMPGILAGRIATMAWAFEGIYVAITHSLYPTILNFLISAYLMYTVHAFFAWVLTIWFIAMMLVTIFMSKHNYELASIQAKAENVVIGKIVDSFQNMNIVRTFHGNEHEKMYLEKYQQDEVKKSKDFEYQSLKTHIIQGAMCVVMLCLMLFFLIKGWQQGFVSPGDFAFIASTAFAMIRMTWWANEQLISANKELGTAKQALQIMKEPVEVFQLPQAKPLKVTKGEIVFDRVSFSYPHKVVFHEQNLHIPAGQKVGLVGFSGSGKTTFINLIMRFFDLQSGQILIDGQDIKEVTLESLRNNISMIPQEPYLFHRSVYENILYGKRDATKEEVIKAAQLAHCEEFIQHLKEGYNTIVGERGSKLSGGQRQRISIARAFLKNAPILFLDEATSAMDSVGEKLIQDSLDLLMKNRTTLVIAHRLSTLFGMDRILVFKNFQIVEDGNHEELLALNGYYAQLWDMQAGGMLPESLET